MGYRSRREADEQVNGLTAYLLAVAVACWTLHDVVCVLKAQGVITRLAMCVLSKQALWKGLELLGIRLPERT